MELDARASIEDAAELRRTVPVLVATVFGFFLSAPLDLEPATVALSGATAAILLTRQRLELTLARIEWATLFFLLGLFVMVGALEQTGAIADAADALVDLTGGDRDASSSSCCGARPRLRPDRQHPRDRGARPGRARAPGLGRRGGRRRLLVGARARRRLRRQRDDRRQRRQHRRGGARVARRAPDRLSRLPARGPAGDAGVDADRHRLRADPIQLL